MEPAPEIDAFPICTTDKLRYRDTDRQGHVNSAVFSTFFETGRVEILYAPSMTLSIPDGEFVIARLALEYRTEVRWPGMVRVGTKIASVGKSSIKLEQAVFQDETCAATVETVIVLIDSHNRQAKPLPDETLLILSSYKR
ncbi:acyl-CoA thioesterase [Pseudochrobactrum kiredjianiae]|uniref:Acyl-CoA thioesterase n=1 Tax=Pseudochrobactrum kiredjianiae TaxID=386305 RepID=A0ABW3V1H4_9HYPH|nr:thioesterase family protein [Pseudochrobactrum kiredjianiae]MDM7853288.1 thioesterase family protein [Pseudochrobactrum kiredjianiae]